MDSPADLDVTIRAARLEDAPAVLALWGQARSAAARTPDDHASVARLVERGSLLVAERDGWVVGALVAAYDGWRGNMYRLAVLAEHRRRGIARQLVHAGHERLRAQGAPRVTALVAHDEVEATALWRAVGYERDEDIVRYVTDL
jgi:ribosomal protein S18 acetylase RimI-like enzyme